MSSERKSLLIFDGYPSHLNIDLIKELGGDGMVVLLRTTKTSHETNVEALVTFGIAKKEFQNAKQSLMTENLVIGNTNGLNRKDFTCLLKQYTERACTTVLNRLGWENPGVYTFDRAPVWRVRKIDIKASATAFAAAEPLTSPKKRFCAADRAEFKFCGHPHHRSSN